MRMSILVVVLLFLLGINTGLRVSDLLALKVKDVKGVDDIQIVRHYS